MVEIGIRIVKSYLRPLPSNDFSEFTVKKIGIILLLTVLAISTYLIFWSRFESTEISLFASIGVIIGIFFTLSERITSAKTPFLEIKAEIDKARSNVKEIEEILASIKSQKDLIDLILRDAKAAQRQMTQIENIANEAHLKSREIEVIVNDTNLKAQQIELLAIDANKRAVQADRDLKKFKKDIDDAIRAAERELRRW